MQKTIIIDNISIQVESNILSEKSEFWNIYFNGSGKIPVSEKYELDTDIELTIKCIKLLSNEDIEYNFWEFIEIVKILDMWNLDKKSISILLYTKANIVDYILYKKDISGIYFASVDVYDSNMNIVAKRFLESRYQIFPILNDNMGQQKLYDTLNNIKLYIQYNKKILNITDSYLYMILENVETLNDFKYDELYEEYILSEHYKKYRYLSAKEFFEIKQDIYKVIISKFTWVPSKYNEATKIIKRLIKMVDLDYRNIYNKCYPIRYNIFRYREGTDW